MSYIADKKKEMKSNYFLYLELISNQKFTKDDISILQNSIEANDDLAPFSDLLVESMDLNFNSHLEIYIEDYPFESDIVIDVENLVDSLDSLIPGGWANDSKIEWISESPNSSIVWYKDGTKWKSVIKENERGFLDEEDDWKPFGGSDGYYDSYDDNY